MIEPVPIGRPSFVGAPRCADLAALHADLAVVGVPYNTPYDMAASRAPCSLAPAAVREQSLRLADCLQGRYDFEFGGDLLASRALRIVDCGDVAMRPGQYRENDRAATAVVRAIVERGVLPVVLGGDQASTIPALRAFEGHGPIGVVHLGADPSWRHEVDGVYDGPSSAMRRASELPWVVAMAQVGLRGSGSARRREVADARAFGSVWVRAEEVHDVGVEEALLRVPEAPRYYVSINAAALDPAIAPGVPDLAFGGLTYFQATRLLQGIARKGRVVGVDWVGAAPGADLANMTSLLGARLLLNLVGALAHTGQIGRGTEARPDEARHLPLLAHVE